MGGNRITAATRAARLIAKRFAVNADGGIAILFAASVTASALAIGGGIDLARAYTAKQKLSHVAALTCQYAKRPSVIQTIAPSYSGNNGSDLYQSRVDTFISSALSTQSVQWTQTTARPFTFSVGGGADVSLTATVPTTFLKLAQVQQLPVAANAHCYDNSGAIDQTVPDGSAPFILRESFSVINCTGLCYVYYQAAKIFTPPLQPNNTFPSTPAYIGSHGAEWYVMGHCLEVDAGGLIRAASRDGGNMAELDCDNGLGTAGNSSISTRVYLPTGDYELRYTYASRIMYPEYDPAYVCASSAADVSWANSTVSVGGPVPNVARTNQINVYLDVSVGNAPATHITLDGSQTLAGRNLIDTCVHSQNWVDRSVKLTVTTPGYYWLSFAADGRSDSYGGLIDAIQLCQKSCPGTQTDAFPTQWTAAGNGGQQKTLFTDFLELPIYPPTQYGIANGSGNMNLSLGSSGLLSGWPGQLPSGWATAPYNQTAYMTTGSASAPQSVQLDGTAPGDTNRYVSRAFPLDPGYYRLEYAYVSNAGFPTLSGSFCGPTPAAANIGSLSGSAIATVRILNVPVQMARDTNTVAAFMSHGQLVSTPVGGGAPNSQTSFNNPNGTTGTNPTVPMNGISLTAYNSAQPNALLDICGHALTWQNRSIPIRITKAGQYWLNFAALGTADGVGGVVDSIRLTAIGTLATTTPPAGAVTIPVPNPQPNSVVGYSGFQFVSNPVP